MNPRTQKIIESLIYYLIWSIVFVVTVIGFTDQGVIYWGMVGRFWLHAVPLFVLFLLNNYLLIPRLLLSKRYRGYVTSVIVAIFAVAAFTLMTQRRPHPDEFPPYRKTGDRPPREVLRSGEDGAGQPSEDSLTFARPDRPGPAGFRKDLPPRPFPVKWAPTFAMFLFSLFIVGLNIAVRLMFKTVNDARVMEELKRRNLRAELDYLKAQVNPHFFMNTLNNIHALVDIDTEQAKDTIIELSKIMRYILYDTDKTFVPLESEVTFIQNYVSLMSIRYTGNITIETLYPDSLPDGRIPPLVLITLVENAFKHGVSYRSGSFISTVLEVADHRVVYSVTNSIQEKRGEGQGMGLENMRKRLTLLYGDDYSLDITENEGCYRAVLDMPLL